MADAPAQKERRPAYSPLAESPYRVDSTERTERWWYADGLWLNQGPVGAVVGFVWTHWLADRGVRLREGELGEDYAMQLYRDARVAMGEDPDEDQGAFVNWAASLLQSRELLEDCYACSDVESVVAALLERGPVVASLVWRESMRMTQSVDGWAVSRLASKSDRLLGGHAILLNGIAKDLEIDGVTGFVRFKNSWGQAWGDDGHALISIEDLREVMGPETLLPIPTADALRPGLAQDLATEGVQYTPKDELYEQTGIDSDLWTRRDTVGADAYAGAIARGIQHSATKPPLTIGIKGAWGTGKTSLMRMIQDRLEWPDRNGTSDKPRKIHLPPETATQLAPGKRNRFRLRHPRHLTNGDVLKAVKEADRGEAAPHTAGPDAPALKAKLGAVEGEASRSDQGRWRPTVWFNPWMYQTGEQIWAGLAHQIIEQITGRMSRRDKELFWLQLNRKRVDEQAVRRKLYGLVLGRAVPYAIVGLVLLLAGIVVLAAGQADRLGTILSAAGPVTALLGTALAGLRVLGSRVNTGLSDLVQPATRAGRLAGDQLADTFNTVVENPDYRGQSGALYLVQTDVRRVLDLVATPEHPLVIFLDDLDRCSPGSVVQVIEAVNLFVAGAYPNTIFVIAMEPEMVAAHVETVYGDLVKQLGQTNGSTGQAFDLGWRFLEKIVQLPLAVPTMEDHSTTALYESLFPHKVDPTEQRNEEEAATDDLPATVDAPDELPLEDAFGLAGAVRPDAASKDAVRRMVELKLTVEDPKVQEVVEYAKDFLRRNPREIKRFVNLFRFFTMIYTERRLQKLPAPASLREVAKLAVLGIRWPGLLSTLSLPSGMDELTIFELLEQPPESPDARTKEAHLEVSLRQAGLNDTMIECLLESELKRFLRSEPMVGPGVRGYL